MRISKTMRHIFEFLFYIGVIGVIVGIVFVIHTDDVHFLPISLIGTILMFVSAWISYPPYDYMDRD